MVVEKLGFGFGYRNKTSVFWYGGLNVPVHLQEIHYWLALVKAIC